MSLGQTQILGLQVMNQAFSRFAHAIALVLLVGAGLEMIGFASEQPSGRMWIALIPLAAITASLIWLDRARTGFRSTVYLTVGALGTFWLGTIVMAEAGPLQVSNASPLVMTKIAVILVGGASFSAWRSIGWSAAGYALATGATLSAAYVTHAPVRVDVGALSVIAILVAMFIVVGLTMTRMQLARPNLARAARDERVSDIRYRIELKAAALMHDTVLSHLAAVRLADVGPLDPELRRQIETDLELLIGEEWLGDAEPEVDSQARADWRRSTLLAAVREVRKLRLEVEITGDLSAVGRLNEERDVALGLAVKQCLVNVLNHADVSNAEVVILGSATDVSVMVIDAGRGFSESLVGADRLGLRQSVRHRIEAVGGAVQIWSTPGRGTSVMIRVPASDGVETLALSDGGLEDGVAIE